MRALRNVLLVSLDYIRPKDPAMPLGIASIVANLHQNDIPHQALVYNVREPVEPERVVHDIMTSSADHVMVGAFVWNEPYVQTILRHVSPHKRVVIGGPQVSYCENAEKDYPDAHAFIRGYAEEAVVQYAKENDVFPGIHFARQPDSRTQATANLSKLPSPLLNGHMRPKRFLRWETQRGCPFHCSFCQHRDPENSHGVQRFDGFRVQQEATWLSDNRIRDIAVLDPTFNTNTLHACWVLSMLPKSSSVSLQIRPEKLNRTFLDAADSSPAGVTLEMGVQTLVPSEMKFIDRIKGGDPTKAVEKVKEKLILAEEYPGVWKMITLIYGLPGQTVDSFRYTMDWCRDNTSAHVVAYPLMLLKGTPLFHRKRELGLVEGVRNLANDNRLSSNIPHVIATPSMSEADWWKMGELASECSASTSRSEQPLESTS